MRIFLVLALAMPLAARAQTEAPADPDVAKARERFRIGQERFNAGDYSAALKEFETARVVKAVPEFEYNIAVCHEHLGHLQDAVDAYKRYIDGTLDPKAIAEAKERVTRLEAEIEKQKAPPPAPAATTAPPTVVVAPAEGPSYTAPVALGVLALALVGVGVALVAPVYHDYAIVSAAWDQMPTLALAQQADYLKTKLEAGWALMGVAGVAAVIDVVLFIRAARSGGEKPRTALLPAGAGRLAFSF